MYIQLPDPKQFNFKDCVIAGDECVLVTPKDMGVEWNDENKIFRSSIWRKSDMHPVSLGYKKFVNYGEKPEFEPLVSHERLEARVKLDGSCLIVSRYKGKPIIRTRGTIDATKLENGYEIAHLILKYPKVFDDQYYNTENITLLFEWTTPSNRIVLTETEEPTLWLIGAVLHFGIGDNDSFYTYFRQFTLDMMASRMEVNRPRKIDLINNETLDEFKSGIEKMEDIEGVVVYDSSNQILKKIKTKRYLRLHRVFTGIKSVDHLIDLWMEVGGDMNRTDFETYLGNTYDWELVVSLKEFLNELYCRWNNIQSKLNLLNVFVDQYRHLQRKEIAEIILEESGIWSSVCFEILSGKKHKTFKLFELIALDIKTENNLK